jgi:MinD superfamily P-loop ATPase
VLLLTHVHNYRRSGFCSLVCPVDAVTIRESTSGRWFNSKTKYGPLVHARLGQSGNRESVAKGA